MGEPGMDRDIRGLVESVMAARLAEELGLNDEQTVMMVRRLSEFKREMNERKRVRSDLLRELRNVLQADAPEEEIETRLNELFRHDNESIEFNRSIYERVCEGLTVTQRAKVYVFLNQFESDMRMLIERARETRRERFRGPDSFENRRMPDMDQPPRDRPEPMPGMERRMRGGRMKGRMPERQLPGMQNVPPDGPPPPPEEPPEGPPEGEVP